MLVYVYVSIYVHISGRHGNGFNMCPSLSCLVRIRIYIYINIIKLYSCVCCDSYTEKMLPLLRQLIHSLAQVICYFCAFEPFGLFSIAPSGAYTTAPRFNTYKLAICFADVVLKIEKVMQNSEESVRYYLLSEVRCQFSGGSCLQRTNELVGTGKQADERDQGPDAYIWIHQEHSEK